MTYTLTAQPNTIVRDEDRCEYQLTAHPNTIIRVGDQAFIPTDPDNIDYQIYLQFLEDGGVPTPYTPPPASKPAPKTG